MFRAADFYVLVKSLFENHSRVTLFQSVRQVGDIKPILIYFRCIPILQWVRYRRVGNHHGQSKEREDEEVEQYVVENSHVSLNTLTKQIKRLIVSFMRTLRQLILLNLILYHFCRLVYGCRLLFGYHRVRPEFRFLLFH